MNTALVIVLFIVVGVLILLSATFSASDMVYLAVNKLRLKKDVEKGRRAAKVALKFADDYDTTITTILFSNNLVNIGATSLLTVIAVEFGKEAIGGLDKGIWSTILSACLLVVLLIFGEILPKVIGRSYSYKLSLLLAYPILVLKVVFFPFVFVSSSIGKFFAWPFTRKAKKQVAPSDEELQEIVDTIEDEGVIDEDQSELIQNAIIFKDTSAHEIMTPRVDMIAYDIEDPIEKLIKLDGLYKHSRIPVYKGTPDHVVGIISSKIVLRKLLAHEEINVEEIISEPVYVPGSMGISEILENMKKTKNHIVIVKDEYGGTDGVLTMEDILEELVGEMYDEMDEVKEPIKKVKRNLYEVDGMMNIDDFFNFFEIESPEEADYDTVGGFVLDKLERFAKFGDKIQYKNLKIEVILTDEFSVEKVLVKQGRKIK